MEKTIDELAREARNRYYRDYRAKNKNRVREINRRYWARKNEALATFEQSQNNGEATENEDRKD